MRSITCFKIDEESRIGEARRGAQSLASHSAWDDEARGRLAIVITELASNLLKHAGSGELLIRPDGRVMHVLSLDHGPGMANVRECMSDGFSQTGTPGTGLGAVRRLSADFDLYSAVGQGTVLYARVSSSTKPDLGSGKVRVAAICAALVGETLSGDSWEVAESLDFVDLLVVDGLGHGPLAHEAAREAVDAFCSSKGSELSAIIEKMHGSMRSTRGAAVSIVRMRASHVEYCGIGNVAGALVAPTQVTRMIGYHGIVGHQFHRIRVLSYPSQPGALLVLHSDGIGSSWDLSKYPDLWLRAPAVIAGVLYRDFRKDRDDATVLVARWER